MIQWDKTEVGSRGEKGTLQVSLHGDMEESGYSPRQLALGVPTWAGGLNQMTSKGLFHLQPFCDSVNKCFIFELQQLSRDTESHKLEGNSRYNLDSSKATMEPCSRLSPKLVKSSFWLENQCQPNVALTTLFLYMFQLRTSNSAGVANRPGLGPSIKQHTD